MIGDVNLVLILLAGLVAVTSPGPATLTIASTSMNMGRRYGLALAAGITTGSWMWSIFAAFGFGALMKANVWAFDLIRYAGACYILFLAYKSARSALTPNSQVKDRTINTVSYKKAYLKGLALHLTNPKAVLFFGSLYSIGIPANTPISTLLIVIAAVALQSFLGFHGYALLFSSKIMVAAYLKAKRWLEALFATAFGFVGIKILTTSIIEE